MEVCDGGWEEAESGLAVGCAAAVGGGSGVAADETVLGLYIAGDRVKTDTRDAECDFSKSPVQLVPVIDGLA